MRILLIEDDVMIGESLCKALRTSGMAVDWIDNGRLAEASWKSADYDLMLLDLGLPGKSGLEILRQLRQEGNPMPVLVLTARDAVADRVKGLDTGADDYLIKPFDLDELEARIRALTRRHAGRRGAEIRVGSLILNPATHEVKIDNRQVMLSAREFALLLTLAERPGVILSRSQLEEKLYGWGEEIGSNAVEVYIHALRKKLGTDVIKNVRGVGYTVPKDDNSF